MELLLIGIDRLQTVLRPLFLSVAGVLLVVATTDWAVRTRRLNPFGPVARFTRRRIDPLLAPIEARVVRRGGLPSAAPFWALGAVIVSGIVILGILDFARGMILATAAAQARGTAGLVSLAGRSIVGVFRLALVVRVIGSWFAASFSRPMRIATRLTEPLLAPIRRILPVGGGIDLSPLILWLLLGVIAAILP